MSGLRASLGRERRRLGGAFGAVALLILGVVYLPPLPAGLERARAGTPRVLDARGGLLREPPGEDGLRAEWIALDDIPEAIVAATIESEDHRLYRHAGVDPVGIARAIWLDARERRVVSGGSTLAMQLARLLWDFPRTVPGKIEQAALGLWLQARLGPDGVLEAWLNLAPYGRDLRGIAIASRAYLGKPPRDLTVGEATMLACLPRAPTLYDPHRGRERLLARRAHVLHLLADRGVLPREAAEAAAREPVHLAVFERAFRAPHAVEVARSEAAAAGHPSASVVQTTIDPAVQRAAQSACRQTAVELGDAGATGCAVVAMRVSTGEILALVGSPDFDGEEAGQFDAALAERQPGSALKPFVYALAFERGWSPASTIDDVQTSFAMPGGDWVPVNYDHEFHGTVRAREALANSYNVPAALLTERLGVPDVLDRMRAAGLATLREDADHYGVGLALGDGEVRLVDLVAAYGTLARGGRSLDPTILAHVRGPDGRSLPLPMRPERRVFSAQAAWLVGHVLQDRTARVAAFGEASVLELPFDAAVKTGTSSGSRDNWTVGFANDVVVGVWVGRPDGAGMHGLSGVSGAAPVWRRVISVAAARGAPRWPDPPAGIVRRRFGPVDDFALAGAPVFALR